MNELLQIIARALVDKPEEVSVVETEENGELNLFLHVADSDMGKVIGKQGRIAKAVRTVVKAAAVGNDKKVNVEIK